MLILCVVLTQTIIVRRTIRLNLQRHISQRHKASFQHMYLILFIILFPFQIISVKVIKIKSNYIQFMLQAIVNGFLKSKLKNYNS